VDLLLLYGPPGVGKLTTARELSRLTGYKLFDNHASIDVIRRVFDFKDEPFWPLVRRLRRDVLEAACAHGVDVITTGAYIYPDDTAVMESGFEIVEKYSARVLLTHLTCDIAELERRVQSEGRANKMNSLETAREDIARHDYFTPIPGRESLHIDNSDLLPEDAARRIIEHYGLPLLEAG
jgi:shikimate kinase